jgi:hypothetical protein
MFSLLGQLLLVLIFFGAVAYALRVDRPLIEYTRGHWHLGVEFLQGSADDFYASVQALLRRLNLPGVNMRVVYFNEASFVSDQRAYLRVWRGDFIFDLCVVRLGTTLFVSSWLLENPRTVLRFASTIPVIGLAVRLLSRLFAPLTYYRVDTGLMFQSAVHGCVLTVLDQMTAAAGLPAIPETARQPVMAELYGKRQGIPV